MLESLGEWHAYLGQVGSVYIEIRRMMAWKNAGHITCDPNWPSAAPVGPEHLRPPFLWMHVASCLVLLMSGALWSLKVFCPSLKQADIGSKLALSQSSFWQVSVVPLCKPWARWVRESIKTRLTWASKPASVVSSTAGAQLAVSKDTHHADPKQQPCHGWVPSCLQWFGGFVWWGCFGFGWFLFCFVLKV